MLSWKFSSFGNHSSTGKALVLGKLRYLVFEAGGHVACYEYTATLLRRWQGSGVWRPQCVTSGINEREGCY